MNALAKGEAEILIYEYIGRDYFGEGVSPKSFAEELKAFGDIRKLHVRINSPGGDVFDGNTIYNILRNHQAYIEVHIDGIAASVASVVAMVGDKIIISENAMMMIHDPWAIVGGEADEMRKMAEVLDKIKTTFISAYKNKSGLSERVISNMMSEETWLNAAEAIKHGLADESEEPVKAAASFDLSCFKNAPATFAKQPRRATNEEAERRSRSYESRKRQIEMIAAT